MSTKTRVVVVDDSALVRGLLAEIIDRQPDMTCIGAAADPLVAREMIRNLNPDVITLDVEMPRMDGIDFLGKLMRLRPKKKERRRRRGTTKSSYRRLHRKFVMQRQGWILRSRRTCGAINSRPFLLTGKRSLRLSAL
jgi:hypothetical protein